MTTPDRSTSAGSPSVSRRRFLAGSAAAGAVAAVATYAIARHMTGRAEALLAVPAGLRLVKVTDVNDALSGMSAAVAGRSAPACSP